MSLSYEKDTENPELTSGITDVPLGDPLAEHAQQALARRAPYPGDDLSNEESFSGQRFVVYRTSDTHHVVLDGARRLEEDLLLPSHLLENPKFCLTDWYTVHLAKRFEMDRDQVRLMLSREPMGDPISRRISEILNSETEFPGIHSPRRFTCERTSFKDEVSFEIHDKDLQLRLWANDVYLRNPKLNVTRWYQERLMKAYRELDTLLREKDLETEFNQLRILDEGPLSPLDCALEDVAHQLFAMPDIKFAETKNQYRLIELNGQQVTRGAYPAIQRNSAIARDFKRLIPKPLVIVVHINGRPARALIDTGSLADFMSTSLADQLRVKKIELEKPLTIQLAVQGSRSKVNFG
ncbi:hypothetical protein P692DRAFT_20749485, partial [Suillus brevipes Sb2]